MINNAILGVIAGQRIAPSGPTDPFWANVVLLLKCDGSSGSTSFVDSSSHGNAITTQGSTDISAFSKFGSGSADIDGGGLITTSADSLFYIGEATQFCAEGWAYRTSSSIGTVFGFAQNNNSQNVGLITYADGVQLNLVNGAGGVVLAGATMPLNEWAHWALDRDAAGNLRIFVGGVLAGTLTGSTGPIQNTATPQIRVGKWLDNSNFAWPGFIDEVRLTIGASRYTTSFTPPSEPFPVGGP